MAANAAKDMGRMRGGAIPPMELVAVCHVPYAQYPQPPRFHSRRPKPATSIAGLWVAGEALHCSSLEGAARGGHDAALAVVAAAQQPASAQRSTAS